MMAAVSSSSYQSQIRLNVFQMMAAVSGNSLAASLLRTAASGTISIASSFFRDRMCLQYVDICVFFHFEICTVVQQYYLTFSTFL